MKKELDEMDLENVTGGNAFQENTSSLRGSVGPHIPADQVRNYKNHLVFVVSDENHESWAKGTLINSYDHTSGCTDYVRHVVDVKEANQSVDLDGIYYDKNNRSVTGEHTFHSTQVTVYLCND